MSRPLNTEERFDVLVAAIISLDISKLRGSRVAQALNGHSAPELASRLLTRINEDTGFAFFANTPLVRESLDWKRIHDLAAKFRKAPAAFPQPVLSGEELYSREEVLGPRYHRSAVKVIQGIVAFLRDGFGAGRNARIPAELSMESRLALYHFATKYPGVRARLAQDLSAEVYSEAEVRGYYESRRRDDMGLFAVTLPA